MEFFFFAFLLYLLFFLSFFLSKQRIKGTMLSLPFPSLFLTNNISYDSVGPLFYDVAFGHDD